MKELRYLPLRGRCGAATSLLVIYAAMDAISCGIEAGQYTPSFEPRKRNTILFVGRITSEKQIDVLLRALTKLPKELDAHVDVIGGGDQAKNLEQLTQQLGIGDRVRFLGKVSDDEVKQAYTTATVFAMPSIAELQSIATMEAMASGLPVVAADAMALPHLVHDQVNGYLFEPGKVNVQATLAPTLKFRPGPGFRYAVSIDDEAPRIVDVHADTSMRHWEKIVSDGVAQFTTAHEVKAAGRHTLKFWALDPGVVLQRVVIDAGGLKPSYLGPQESPRVGAN